MTNRKKRLRKGIASIEEEILIHKEKLATAEKEDKPELVKYYMKEIERKKEDRDEKKRLLEKGG